MISDGRQKFLTILERILLYGFLLIAPVGGLVFGWIISDVSSGKELSLLASYRPSIPTKLYDRNGIVFAELFKHKQELIAYRDIPPHVVQAFLAVEDDNFFHHFGIDFFGIGRAIIKNTLAMRIVQGGSTLTQQLAKQIYLNVYGERQRTYAQKLKETILALQMEEELSKEQILEVYFNVIYLGHGCQGITCASRLYFDKKVQDLTVAEAALLARMPKSPVEFSPFKNPREAMRQHKIILNLMAKNKFIQKDQADRIHHNFWEHYWSKIIVQSPSQNIWAEKMDKAPFFTEYVRQILEASDSIGADNLYTKGLKVYTTLDLQHQSIAEQEMKRTLVEANRTSKSYAKAGSAGGVDSSLFGIFGTLGYIFPVGRPDVGGLDAAGHFRKELEGEVLDGGQLLTYFTPAWNENSAFEEFRKSTMSYSSNLEVQGAFISIEPRTGYITAMIGGSDFSPQNQFNRVLSARRQPGSAFKVFVYGAALEQRVIGTNSGLNDAPLFTIDASGSSWSPGNYDEGFRGMVPVSTAFALSLNTCSVQTYFKTGARPIINFASRLMKISNRRRFTVDPALSLGASEVTPMEMATAIAIIANQGRDVIPFPVRYVTSQSGDTLYNQEAQIRRVLATKTKNGEIQMIEPALAYLLRTLMRGVVDHGTAVGGVRGSAGFRGDLAAKTGTTSSWSDAWIVGFNPEYASSIWFGFDRSSITMGPGQAGGHLGAPFLGNFYRKIYDAQNMKPPSFAEPDASVKADLIPGPCGGTALAPKLMGGVLKSIRYDDCASESNRIYDQRELLMKELGITPEDLGTEGRNVKFKREE